MFNAEKLLGGLLLGGTRRKSGLGSLATGGAGMVILGVAMEAIEHLMKKSEAPSPGSSPPPPPGSPSSPPPPPRGPVSAPSPSPQAAPPPLPPRPAREQGAVLLIRAMIAAANADGTIEQEERSRILGQLKRLNLTQEEQSFIVQELLSPASLDAIVSEVRSGEVAKQVYAVSLLAIEVDTDAERSYMKSLAERLGLDEGTIGGIHEGLGIPPRA